MKHLLLLFLFVIALAVISSLIPEGSIVNASYNDDYTERTHIKWYSPQESASRATNAVLAALFQIVWLNPVFLAMWILKQMVTANNLREAGYAEGVSKREGVNKYIFLFFVIVAIYIAAFVYLIVN